VQSDRTEPSRIERITLTALAALFAALAALFLASIAYDSTWFEDGIASDIAMIDDALHLSLPDEPLMDLKGETVYRRRPYYYVFEKITRDAIRAGLLPDRVAEPVVAAKCHVVQVDGPFSPARSRMFLSANYLGVGRLRTSGQWVQANGSFAIAVPGRYVLLSKSGEAAGVLDGVPYSGPRDLLPGSHRFVGTRAGRVACLWGPAFERGFSPFRTKGREGR
jgi:hypothetical protein